MTPHQFEEAERINGEIELVRKALEDWERADHAGDNLLQANVRVPGMAAGIPLDAWHAFKRECKQHLQDRIDKLNKRFSQI